MRFLVAGLVLIAVGVGLSEYTRRHPSEVKSDTSKSKSKTPTYTTPPSMTGLIETKTGSPDAPGDAAALSAALQKLTVDTKADGFTTVLSGDFSGRELHGSAAYGVFIFAPPSGGSGLVRVPRTGAPSVIVARKNVISAVAIDGDTVLWAEGGRVFSTPADGNGQVTARIEFSRAAVTSLAAKAGVLLAALSPKGGDPFSTDPTGAVVKISSGGEVTFVASEQVRPDNLLLEDDVFFTAGSPTALVRASLDGSFSAHIADRADGPLCFDGEGIVHRVPQASAPEVRRVARAGGNGTTLVHGEADWLVCMSGATRYTTVGIGSRLYQVTAGGDPQELGLVKGTAKGLATIGDATALLSSDDSGTTLRLR